MVKLPVRFNPTRLLAENSVWFAEIPVRQFARFAEGLSSEDGQVRVELRLSREPENNRIVADGQFEAQCKVLCQRCLADMEQTISGRFSLTFVTDAKTAEALPDEYDPVILDEHGQIHVVDLLEDDLILQTPLAPVHEDIRVCETNGYDAVLEADDTSSVGSDGQATGEDRKNPFEVLKNISKND